jgi:hypothetical protein
MRHDGGSVFSTSNSTRPRHQILSVRACSSLLCHGFSPRPYTQRGEETQAGRPHGRLHSPLLFLSAHRFHGGDTGWGRYESSKFIAVKRAHDQGKREIPTQNPNKSREFVAPTCLNLRRLGKKTQTDEWAHLATPRMCERDTPRGHHVRVSGLQGGPTCRHRILLQAGPRMG